MLLGKHKKQSVWLYDNVLLFLECACHTSHTCPDLNRPRSTTCGTKGCMKNCFGLAGETVPGSTTTVWRALSTLSTVLCLCGMKLKRSISTRSLPSKAPQNSSPQKCFFHTGPANPGYLACSSVDPGKGPEICKMCWPCKFLPHSRSLYTALPTLAPLAHFERVETLRSFESPQGNFSLPGGFKCDTVAS